MELREFLATYYELFSELEVNKAQFCEEFYEVARKQLRKTPRRTALSFTKLLASCF